MLTSPKFLFDVDVLERDPAQPGTTRLDAYSKASRLSLFLWNAPPDPVLLDAAALGALHTDQGLAQQVDRLIASPRFARLELASRFAREGQPLRDAVREAVTSDAFFAVPLASRPAVSAVPR